MGLFPGLGTSTGVGRSILNIEKGCSTLDIQLSKVIFLIETQDQFKS